MYLVSGICRCFGGNAYGQLGTGSTTSVLSAPSSDQLASVSAVSVGNSFTCVRMTSTGIRCWGDNSAGQLGISKTTTKLMTIPSSDTVTGVSVVSAGGHHTCALFSSSQGVRCWGDG